MSNTNSNENIINSEFTSAVQEIPKRNQKVNFKKVVSILDFFWYHFLCTNSLLKIVRYFQTGIFNPRFILLLCFFLQRRFMFGILNYLCLQPWIFSVQGCFTSIFTSKNETKRRWTHFCSRYLNWGLQKLRNTFLTSAFMFPGAQLSAQKISVRWQRHR